MSVVPEVFVRFEDSEWPPAQHDTPVGTGLVGGFSLERQLVSAALPGNLRGRSGLSVGTCQNLTIRQSFPAEMTPWGRGSRRVKPGGRAHLYTSPSGRPGDVGESLGAWLVDPLGGAVGGASMSVDLIEASSAGKVENLLPPAVGAMEPTWIFNQLARQLGYYSTPPASEYATLSATLVGGTAPELGLVDTSQIPNGAWNQTFTTTSLGRSATGESLFLFFELSGSGTVEMRLPVRREPGTASGGLEAFPLLRISANGALSAANRLSSWANGTWTPGPDGRVEVELQRFANGSGDWTSFRARARGEAGAAWGPWVTSAVTIDPGASLPWGGNVLAMVPSGATLRALQVTTQSDPRLWDQYATVDIKPITGTLEAAYLPGDLLAWDAIQQMCDAWQAAAWITRDGVLTIRGREHLSGATSPLAIAATIDADRDVEKLNWREDPGDFADRVEITYCPPTRQGTTFTGSFTLPIAGKASEPVTIRGRSTVDVVIELDGAAYLLRPWVPGWDAQAAENSMWAANTAPDGSGTQASSTALSVSHRQVSAGRVVVSVTNTTSGTLYTVNGSGEPALALRASYVVTQADTSTISRGLPADQAKNPLTIDLGKFVQTAADAEAVADYIWARVQEPGTQIEKIRVPFDPVIDIGDIRRLVHEPTGLDAKVLIVGVTVDAGPGQMGMLLDVVALPPTVADFNHVWRGRTVAEFDDFWAGKNVAAFNDNPLAIGA